MSVCMAGDVEDPVVVVERIPDTRQALARSGHRAVVVDLTPADVASVARVSRVVLVRPEDEE